MLSAELVGDVQQLSVDWSSVAQTLVEIGDSQAFFLLDEHQQISLTLERPQRFYSNEIPAVTT